MSGAVNCLKQTDVKFSCPKEETGDRMLEVLSCS